MSLVNSYIKYHQFLGSVTRPKTTKSMHKSTNLEKDVQQRLWVLALGIIWFPSTLPTHFKSKIIKYVPYTT